MLKEVVKKCICGCPKTGHRFHEVESAAEILNSVTQDNINIQISRDPNTNRILGYKLLQGPIYYTYDQALARFEQLRDERSKCGKCCCKIFRMDNLKYLEELSERATSQIIH
jgi:hypothetical protein